MCAELCAKWLPKLSPHQVKVHCYHQGQPWWPLPSPWEPEYLMTNNEKRCF